MRSIRQHQQESLRKRRVVDETNHKRVPPEFPKSDDVVETLILIDDVDGGEIHIPQIVGQESEEYLVVFVVEDDVALFELEGFSLELVLHLVSLGVLYAADYFIGLLAFSPEEEMEDYGVQCGENEGDNASYSVDSCECLVAVCVGCQIDEL